MTSLIRRRTRFVSAAYFHLKVGQWLSIAVCLALMLCAVIFTPQTHVGRRGRIAAAVLAAACAAGILVVHTMQMPRGGIVEHNEYFAWNDAASHDTLSETYAEFTNANRCLMFSGLYQFTVRGAVVTIWPQTTADTERIAELDAYYAAYPKQAADTPMTGAFAGKNLILIMMESIDDWLVTPEYMPNLYHLEQEGVYFRNYYAPIFLAAATFNSEFTANTGLIAPEYQVRNSYYAEHALPYSLANLFRDAGYRARSYHAANPNIYNRGQIHLNFGYESYNDYGDLGMDDYMLDSQLLRGYDQIVSDEPFFSFIITYSGHGPYTTEQQNISEPHLDRARTVIDYSTVPYTTEAQKEEYTRAVAQAMETDAFIGGLRERLEADGHAEDTVLMLFTDHYCKYFSDAELISAIKGETDRNMLSNVPFVIWTEGITPQVSEKYVSTMDIAPTIVDLFSLDADLRYYIGNDMFGPDGGVVYLRNYVWYDGKTYDTGSDDAPDPAVLAVRRQVREQLDVSQDTFRYDYFAHLQRCRILNPDGRNAAKAPRMHAFRALFIFRGHPFIPGSGQGSSWIP